MSFTFIGRYLADLKADPMNSTPQVREPDGKVVVFTSHADVDEYVEKIKSRPTLYEELMPLLKAFDRAFWLKELKNDEEPRQTCPFQGITMLPGVNFGKDAPGDQKLKAEIDANAILGQQQQQEGISGPQPAAGAADLAKYDGQDLSITVNELQERLEIPLDESQLQDSQGPQEGFAVGTPPAGKGGPSAFAAISAPPTSAAVAPPPSQKIE